MHDGVAHLAEVVRGHLGRHTDGDTVGTVHQQVGELGGQDGGLLERSVVVVDHVDGVLVQVRHQIAGHLGQPGLGVTHGGRGVPVDRTEVTLTVHQRVPERERLGHPHHRLVRGGVAVRVVLTEHLSHHGRGLLVGAVVLQSQAVHGEHDLPVDRLETVADVGQGAPDDDAHGVVDVGALHLLLDGLDYEFPLSVHGITHPG